MIFSKNKAIILISRNGFQIVSKKLANLAPFSFPPDAVGNLEIVNEVKLNEAIGGFIKNNAIGAFAAIILLSDEITYQKSLVSKDEKLLEDEINKFIEEVPFGPSVIAYKTISLGDQKIIVATNRALFGGIAKIFTNYGWKIKRVVSASSLGLSNLKTIEAGDIGKIFKMASGENTDFLVKERPEETNSQRSTKLKIKILLVLLTIILISGAVAYILKIKGFWPFNLIEKTDQVQQDIDSNTENKIETKDVATESSQLESTGEASLISDRSLVRILVLNGTGINGEEAFIRDQLSTFGYQNFSLGNAQITDNPTAEVKFSNKLSEEIKGEVEHVLKGTFKSVTTSVVDEESDYDVTITTGERLST